MAKYDRKVGIRMQQETFALLEEYAKTQKRTVSYIINEAIECYIQQKNSDKFKE